MESFVRAWKPNDSAGENARFWRIDDLPAGKMDMHMTRALYLLSLISPSFSARVL